MLTDYRLAGVPSLRVNQMHWLPATDEDVDKMEVVLGPGSALYGPNTANGIVHVLTKSPLTSPGTSVTLGGGERSVRQASFRSAFLLGDDFGFKAMHNRMHIHDLHATLLHAMGLDHKRLTYRYSGRDFRLTDVHGNVIHDVLT